MRRLALHRPLVLAVVLAGCATTGPIVVPLRDSAPPVATAPAGARPCRIVVTAVEDERQNKTTLGVLQNRTLEAEGVSEWVEAGLAGLARDATDRPVPDLAARIGIERVSARTPTTTQMEAVVALRAMFNAADGRVTERRYRGVATRLNWASGGREFAAALNDALATAAGEVVEDAARLCPAR